MNPYIYIYNVYMLKDWVSEVPDVKQTTYASKKRQNIKKLTKINKTKLFF